MTTFIVPFTFKQRPDEEMLALIPQEQARIKELMGQGVVVTLYLSAERTRGWLVMRGESQSDVQQALGTLPLHKFMDLEIIPLAGV